MTNILTRDTRAVPLARRERPVRPGLVLAIVLVGQVLAIVLVGQFMAVLDASIVNIAARRSTPACARPGPACS